MNFNIQKVALFLGFTLVVALGFFNDAFMLEQCGIRSENHQHSQKIKVIKGRNLHQILFPTDTEDPLFRQYDQYVGNDLTLICVDSPDNYQDCYIPESINIPLNQLESAASNWNRTKEIVVYGSSPSEGHSAFRLLTGLGFKNVRVYEGGMSEWKVQFSDHCLGRCAR